MPRRVGDFRGLTHISRLRLLDAVQREPGQKLQDLADATGLHINTARDHLRVLEGEGLIQSYSLTTGSRGRPPQVFHPVDDASTSPVAARRAEAARVRGEMLRRLEPELDHTDDLGAEATHQIDTLFEHLDDSGLEPSSGDDPLEMDLVPCHVEMIRKDRHLLCTVHERLIEQHLEQLPGPVELRELKPFAEKHRCSLTLVVREDREVRDDREVREVREDDGEVDVR